MRDKLRSATRVDEVDLSSERQRSLRSQSRSPPRNANSMPIIPKRSFEDEVETELPKSKKKKKSRSGNSASTSSTSTDLTAGSHDNQGPDMASNGSIIPAPASAPSSQSVGTAASSQGNVTANVAAPAVAAPTTIYSLPTEMIQLVMEHIPRDKDIISFALTAKKFHSCYTPSVLGHKFRDMFDALNLVKGTSESSTTFAQRELDTQGQQYSIRKALTKRYVSFSAWGRSAERSQNVCIDTMMSMVLTSDATISRETEDDILKVVGKNHTWLFNYFKSDRTPETRVGTDYLDYVEGGRSAPHSSKSRQRQATKREVALKLCLTHLMLNPKIPQRMTRFVDSQAAVYTCMRRMPLFKGRSNFDINFDWLEHAGNFFKYHFRQQNGEGLLTHLVEGLAEANLPRAWPGKLTSGTQKLGPKWKGAFTYIGDDEQLMALRNGTLEESAEDETSEDNDGFQDLTIYNDIAGIEDLKYPELYEQELKSMPKGSYPDRATRQKVTPQYKDFFGLGKAKTDYHLFGRMHALPPQAGIPGWQRVTMMKEMPDEATKAYGPGLTNLWAYEGVVLPGGQIIIGRWWSPFRNDALGNSYCGPFIFWQVASDVEKNNTMEALDFLRMVKDNTA